jgi:protein-S-isoprenylcysteine O-methyltransferase Ste14
LRARIDDEQIPSLFTALAVGRWRGVVAVGLMGLTLWRKLRIEERGMRQLFGEQYTLYAKRVSALIPFLL